MSQTATHFGTLVRLSQLQIQHSATSYTRTLGHWPYCEICKFTRHTPWDTGHTVISANSTCHTKYPPNTPWDTGHTVTSANSTCPPPPLPRTPPLTHPSSPTHTHTLSTGHTITFASSTCTSHTLGHWPQTPEHILQDCPTDRGFRRTYAKAGQRQWGSMRNYGNEGRSSSTEKDCRLGPQDFTA